MKIGPTIGLIRKQKNIKQKDLAVKSAITQSYLSLIESNDKSPSIETLQSIADALGIPLSLLFFLSVTEQDIPENKREAFKLIRPFIKDMIDNDF